MKVLTIAVLVLSAGISVLTAQTQQPTPFKANAQLGVPARVGSITTVSGSKEILEIGALRELTLESAELALTFPNRAENVVAKATEKLLILRGSIRNPEKTSTVMLGPSSVIALRLVQRYTGSGKFAFVMHFDPDTLQPVRQNLKGGQSCKFVGVWRIPDDFDDFRLGMYSDRPNLIAWYDLTSTIRRLPVRGDSLPAIDGLEIAQVSGGVVQARGSERSHYAVSLNATNRMLLPVRWGWQYFTTELVGADGSVTKAYPDMIDESTGRPWVGDLDPGATTRSRFLFYPDGNSLMTQPRAFRMTVIATGRRLEIDLTR